MVFKCFSILALVLRRIKLLDLIHETINRYIFDVACLTLTLGVKCEDPLVFLVEEGLANAIPGLCIQIGNKFMSFSYK